MNLNFAVVIYKFDTLIQTFYALYFQQQKEMRCYKKSILHMQWIEAVVLSIV